MNNFFTIIISGLMLQNSTAYGQVNYSFKATTATYEPVVGGTTPPLFVRPWNFGQTSLTYDEGLANSIPIGFEFNYNGVVYTTINICANGFATLGAPFDTNPQNIEAFFINSLRLGLILHVYGATDTVPDDPNTKPILAPLWDDLNLQANTNLRYITTGAAGSRVFTFEWSKAKWQFDAAGSTVSFELKLYEGSNIVQFCYKDEGGTPSAGASASIGITASTKLGGGFISLQSTSSSPAVSNTGEVSTLNKKPANNQVYSFIPLPCPLPLNVHYTSSDNTSVNFSWDAPNGVKNFEYAITTSLADPATSTSTALTSAVVSSLSTGTKYYIHVHSYCSASSQSAWLAVPFATSNNTSPPPPIAWQKSIGGSGLDGTLGGSFTRIKQTTNGGYIFEGSTNSVDGNIIRNHGGIDWSVVKLNSDGSVNWQKCLGGSGDDIANDIEQTADGGYIVAGGTQSVNGDITSNHGLEDFWVVKLNSLGVIEWQKTLGGTNYEQATSIKQNADGSYIVAGLSLSNDGDVTGNHGNVDIWVLKLNASGNLLWEKSFGTTNDDYAYEIQLTTDGGYIFAGGVNTADGDVTDNFGGEDYWVVKLDGLGNIVWQKSLGGSSTEEASSIQNTPDGGYIVAGITFSNDGNITNNHGAADTWIVKLDNTGSIIWQKSFGGSGYDNAKSIAVTSDSGYIISVDSQSNDGDVNGNHGFSDYWIFKLDRSGGLQWQKSIGGSKDDAVSLINETKDGGYIISGTSNSNNGDVSGNHGEHDFWIVKLGTDDLLPVTLLNFSGEIDGKSNLLKWVTTAEQNNTGFEVQRSADGYNFNKIGFVNSKAVTSNNNHKISYNFSDFTYTSATNYYRLKQIDKDGNFSLSNIVLLKNDKVGQNAISLYPNPVTDVLNITVAPQGSDKITFSIIDVAGRTLQSKVTHVSSSAMNIQLDVSKLPAGIYFLKILSGDGSENAIEKFVKK